MPEQCLGKSRQTGERCRLAPVPGRRHCKWHGGHAGRGIHASNYGICAKTGALAKDPGSRSKYVPSRLMKGYAEAEADPERLTLSHEISLWMAREEELLRRVDSTDPGASWRDLQEAWRTVKATKAALDLAQSMGDVGGMRRAYEAFKGAIEAGDSAISSAESDYGLFERIQEAAEFLMRLRAQEHKRLLELNQYWSAEQVRVRWHVFYTALWDTCMAALPRDLVRPFLNAFEDRIKGATIDYAAPQTPQPTPRLASPEPDEALDATD